MKIDLPSPLVVVCHDAGATNLILPWLRSWEGESRLVMEGPARRIWASLYPERPLWDNLESAMQDAGALLSGTGWGSSIEHRARVIAARTGMRSVAVVDHWVNYAMRFEREGFRQLPDEIWVTDMEALAIAHQIFAGVTVRCKPNLYVQEQLCRIGAPPGRDRVLYVAEPVRADWGRGIPGEFQALEYAVEHLDRLGLGPAPELRLRLHPSEAEGKYSGVVDRYPSIGFDRSPDLAAAISGSDVVIGVESFALTVAVQAGRRVYCSLPPWAPEFRLPHQSITQIRFLRKQ